MLVAGLSAYMGNDLDSLPSFNGGNIFHGNVEKTDEAILDAVAAYAVVMGIAGSHRRGVAFTPPSEHKSYYFNLFTMMGLVDSISGAPDPLKLSCFRRFAVINSDHGMALSIFANLVTASSLADPISGLIAALAAAYGPLHFGAPEAAYKTIGKIGRPENIPAFLDEVKTGKRRLFGYGHRTYKTIDPRLAPIKAMVWELDMESNPLLKIAREIDRLSATDDYFTKRNLHANGDFYGCFCFIGM
jgi:citrate synthase